MEENETKIKKSSVYENKKRSTYNFFFCKGQLFLYCSTNTRTSEEPLLHLSTVVKCGEEQKRAEQLLNRKGNVHYDAGSEETRERQVEDIPSIPVVNLLNCAAL